MSDALDAPAVDRSPWAPLRIRVFRALFIAQLASNLGTLMQAVGAAWLIGDLGATAVMVALVQTATFLPVVLFGVTAGALADLVDRRLLLIAGQVGMMLAATTMAVLTFVDVISPAGVLGLTFVLGLGGALVTPAWFAIQPDLVGKAYYPQAVALGAMTFNVGRAVGPAIGGLIIASAGPAWVFVLNAVSFVGTVAVLAWWRPESKPTSSLPAETLRSASIAGLRYGLHSPLVHTVLVRVWLLVFPAYAIQALLPVVVRGPLDWSSSGYGILLGCFGVGATVAAVARPRVAERLLPDAVVAIASLVLAGALVVQGFVTDRVVVGAGLIAAGFAWALATTETIVAAQAAMPDWVRGRGLALYSMALTGGIAAGSAVFGLIANWDLQWAHLIAAVLLGASPLAAMRWPLGRVRAYDLTLLPGDQPQVTMQPQPDDGPVLVSVTYRVDSETLDEFRELMVYTESHRRRTGAFRWGLYRDLGDPTRFVEHFLVSSWAEHLRQHHRTTARADQMLQRLSQFIDPSTPFVDHLISTRSPGAMAPHVAQPPDEHFVNEV